MARYIDADELLKRLPDDLPYKASVKRVLIQAPTADVVPRCEVEELNRAYLEYEETSGLKQAKTEIAREIFEEIDNALIENFHADCQMGDCIEDYYDDNLRDDIFKIKKKYTEEKKDDNQN